MPTYERRKVLPSTKLHPFRVIVWLLYAKYDWIEEVADNRILMKTGPAARQLRVPTSKVRDYMVWAEQAGYVRDVVVRHGEIECQIVPPLRAA